MNQYDKRLNEPEEGGGEAAGCEDIWIEDQLVPLRSLPLPGSLRASNRARIRAALASSRKPRVDPSPPRSRRRAGLPLTLAAAVAAALVLGALAVVLGRGGSGESRGGGAEALAGADDDALRVQKPPLDSVADRAQTPEGILESEGITGPDGDNTSGSDLRIATASLTPPAVATPDAFRNSGRLSPVPRNLDSENRPFGDEDFSPAPAAASPPPFAVTPTETPESAGTPDGSDSTGPDAFHPTSQVEFSPSSGSVGSVWGESVIPSPAPTPVPSGLPPRGSLYQELVQNRASGSSTSEAGWM